MKEINKQLNLFDKLYRKSLQDNVIDKKNMKVFVVFLLNILMKKRMNLFLNMNLKLKLNFFSYNKLKFQPRT